MKDTDFMADFVDDIKDNNHDIYKYYGFATTDSEENITESDNPETLNARKFLDLDDWDKLIDMVNNGTLDPTKPLTKGKTLVKLAIVQRRMKFLNDMIQNKPDIFLHTDYNSGTPLHIAAKHGYWDILKLLLPICKNIINYRGIASENFIFHVDDSEVLTWCLENYPEIDLYMVSRYGKLYIVDSISLINNGDEYERIVKILIAHMDPLKIKTHLSSIFFL